MKKAAENLSKHDAFCTYWEMCSLHLKVNAGAKTCSGEFKTRESKPRWHSLRLFVENFQTVPASCALQRVINMTRSVCFDVHSNTKGTCV